MKCSRRVLKKGMVGLDDGHVVKGIRFVDKAVAAGI